MAEFLLSVAQLAALKALAEDPAAGSRFAKVTIRSLERGAFIRAADGGWKLTHVGERALKDHTLR